jgi:DNA repair and recombination protein RAD54 and RAD54-like protein
MDCPSPKRQKHGNEHANLQGNQSPSSIFSHNRRVRLEFLEQINELKHESITKDLKDINTKRRHVISILEKLEQAPIRLPYASPLLKPSHASLYNFGQSGKNHSSDNIIDLDPDEDSAGVCTHADVANIGADATVVADSSNENGVKSFGSESSSPKPNANYIQHCLLPDFPVKYQDIIILDNCNSNTEPQILTKQGKDNVDIDDASDKVRSACHEYSCLLVHLGSKGSFILLCMKFFFLVNLICQ